MVDNDRLRRLFMMMSDVYPIALQLQMENEASDFGGLPIGTLNEVIELCLAEELTQSVKELVHRRFSSWDAVDESETWTKSTPKQSEPRRNLIYRRLGIPEGFFNQLTTVFPRYEPIEKTIWSAVLEGLNNDLGEEVANSVSKASSAIVQKILSARKTKSGAVKGMVVGHVQSGKTQNMIAVAAQLIDEGIDLVIVLAGTKELLRIQTQERFDQQLCGRATAEYGPGEYTPEEKAKFIKHSRMVHRLTTRTRDFKEDNDSLGYLKLDQLHRQPSVLVVKKNKNQLQALMKRIKKLNGNSGEGIRALILDDECDSASPNSATDASDVQEHTATNKNLRQLLDLLPSSVYVGYSATPYANICIDVGGSDIYPDDFVHVLPYPTGYHGYESFFDIDNLRDYPEERDANWINWERINFRLSSGPNDNPAAEQVSLEEAIDDWVIAGAIKLWRLDRNPELAASNKQMRYHTLLYHDSHKTENHNLIAEELRALWEKLNLTNSGFKGNGEDVLARLGIRFPNFLETFQDSRYNEKYDFPLSIEDIYVQINRVIHCSNMDIEVIEQASNGAGHPSDSAVVVINKDSVKAFKWDQRSLQMKGEKFGYKPTDFEFCKIIIGGNMMSRGFTVEGLTTVYFGRCSKQADTLLQMCRWFGYRDGYRDVMRIFFQPLQRQGKEDILSPAELLERFRLFGCVDRDIRELLEAEQDNWNLGEDIQAPLIARLVTRYFNTMGERFPLKLTAKANGWTMDPVRRTLGERYRFDPLSLEPEKRKITWDSFVDRLSNLAFEDSMSVVERPENRPKGKNSVSWLVAHVDSDVVKTMIAKTVIKPSKSFADIEDLANLALSNGDVQCVLLVRTLLANGNRWQATIGSNSKTLYAGRADLTNGLSSPITSGGPIDRSIDGALGRQDCLKEGDVLSTQLPFKNRATTNFNVVVLVVHVTAEITTAEDKNSYPAVGASLYFSDALRESVSPTVPVPHRTKDSKGNQRSNFVKQGN